MWIGVLWAGLRVAMWITHVGGKFCHGLLEESLMFGLEAPKGGRSETQLDAERLKGP